MPEVLDLTVFDFREPHAAAAVVDVLRRQGMALFSGVCDRPTLRRAGRTVLDIRAHRDSDPDGVTVIEQRIAFAATGSLAGFTDQELLPHTDGSAVAEPPGVLMLACLRPARTGGAVVLVDGRRLHRDIATEDPAMLAALSAPRSAYFGGASGHLGSVFERAGDGRVAVRLRLDSLVRFSPAASLYVSRLHELVQRLSIPLDLAVGDGYVLLNDRWLHGRKRFTGGRTMLRLIGDPPLSCELPRGFQPAPCGAVEAGSGG